MYSDAADMASAASMQVPPADHQPDAVIRVQGVSKCFQIYDSPQDRLKQFLVPRIQRFLGLAPRRYFREFWALRDVSFAVERGQTVGIIGRNGSGKSTLLQIICGTLHPSAGRVEVQGRVAALLELGSGFNPEFTGRENVYLNAGVLGLSAEETRRRFDDIASFADIGDFIEQPVKSYSTGMLVRLAFAVIAHVDADILVIDEALAVGDAFFTQKCMRFLRQFMKTGTVLFVSHDPGSVRALCNEALWLEKGQVLEKGNPKAVTELYLEAFYEAAHGKSTTTRLKPVARPEKSGPIRDPRMDLINTSNLRNDLAIFQFDPDAPALGKGGARIVAVEFLSSDGAALAWVVGGETVRLRIRAIAGEDLVAPILGFAVKDRLGQVLFGDNTYLSHAGKGHRAEAGDEIEAEFTFQMPVLPVGHYSVNAAIATGTQQEHIQHHWIHDALQFRSESSSVVTGLVGIPMLRITLDVAGRMP